MPSRAARAARVSRDGGVYVAGPRPLEPCPQGWVDGPVQDWHMTQEEFLAYALRTLGPERARVALRSLEEEA